MGRDDSARHPPARGPLAGRAAFLKVASLDFYRKRPRRLRRGGCPHFFPKKWGERRAGGLRPPWTPQYGGSWRRWVVRAGQRPGVHCRPLPWRFCYRRCRASGGTHRDYPASLGSGCAVPTWPAGPPSVPCLRNTGAAAVAGKRRVKDAAPYIVGPSYGSFASGQARKLIPSAGPPLPTEPAAQPLAALPPYGCGVPLAGTSLGFGGGPSYRKRQPMGRAAMHGWSLPCLYSPPPP